MEFKDRIGGLDAARIAKHLGLDEVGQETDVATKIHFKHTQEGIYHYIEYSMEI